MSGRSYPSRLWQPFKVDFEPYYLVLVVYGLLLTPSAFAQQTVGTVTTVQQEVDVTHPGQDRTILIKHGDGVLFLDKYETKIQARAKLLFDDDSLVTLGENTTLQVTKYVYNPAENLRSTTMEVLSGRIRALLGEVFTGTGSRFEIHTPTAVAAARGTYYIVWLFEQGGDLVTGVVSLADQVEVSNIDANIPGTVQLEPNQYTIVAKGKPPTPAAPMESSLLEELLSSTGLPDVWLEAIPSEIQQPMPGLIAETPPVPSVLAVISSVPSVTETGVPNIPPILQQPVQTTPVTVEVQFPK